MRAVFDLDDTICVTENRDYANSKPVDAVVSKIRQLKRDGWEVIIYSSRGQVSCKGNLREIERRNRPVVESWLKENDVPYDELIFGKPIADLYVDDKAMNVFDFCQSEFHQLNGGGSRKSIYRIGNVVKKDLGSAEETERFKEWIADNKGVCLYPRIISYLYSGVYMDYIDGLRLVDCCNTFDLYSLLLTIFKFSFIKKKEFTLKPQLDILEANKSQDEEWNRIIDITRNFLLDNEKVIASRASFCHGDLTLSNVIKRSSDSALVFIDPRYFRESSTFLFDLAKLRMSLMDYEYLFGISKNKNSDLLKFYDNIIAGNELTGIVNGLTLMFICRLYRYKNDDQKQIVIDMAKKVLTDNAEIFKQYY